MGLTGGSLPGEAETGGCPIGTWTAFGAESAQNQPMMKIVVCKKSVEPKKGEQVDEFGV